MLRQVQLSDQPDRISWRFTPNDEYSVKSAYLAQYAGSFSDYEWSKWWRARQNISAYFSVG
jgi:hypothetical protein